MSLLVIVNKSIAYVKLSMLITSFYDYYSKFKYILLYSSFYLSICAMSGTENRKTKGCTNNINKYHKHLCCHWEKERKKRSTPGKHINTRTPKKFFYIYTLHKCNKVLMFCSHWMMTIDRWMIIHCQMT
jgi:hypothetical protein